MPITAFDGPCIATLQPGVSALSLAAGLWQPDGQLDLVGIQDSFTGGQDHVVTIEIATGLRQVSCAVAQISLASLSNAEKAVNAAWRIQNYDTQLNIPGPGSVRVVVTVQVHDNDGYLEGLSFSVQALGLPSRGPTRPRAVKARGRGTPKRTVGKRGH
jgi:hypothetical protein